MLPPRGTPAAQRGADRNLRQGLDQMDAEIPANLSNLVMLWVVNNWNVLEALS